MTRIAFVGAGCTGKTALLERKKLEHAGDDTVAFVDEAARRYFEQHPEIPESDRFKFMHQLRVQNVALDNETRVYVGRPRLTYLDRCAAVDPAVYVTSTGDKSGGLLLALKTALVMPSYSRIYLCSPEGVPFENDAIRKESGIERQHIHEAYIGFFATLHVPYVLLEGSLDERSEMVSEFVSTRTDSA